MYHCLLGYVCSLADLQQFFTGKLYVLMYQLKLPAEELLWSAISCTEDLSVPSRDRRIKTDSNSSYLCSMFMCSHSHHDTCCIM